MSRFFKTLGLFLLAGAIIGFVSGYLTAAYDAWGDTNCFARSTGHPFHCLECLGFLGMELAESRAPWDWQMGEAWTFRYQVALWNLTFWIPASFGLFCIMEICRNIKPPRSKRSCEPDGRD